jgi:hypothetical protein
VAGENINFYARYTTLVEGTYYSDPYEVTGYKSVAVEVFLAALINSGTATGRVQGSSDMETWTDLGSNITPSAGASDTETITDPPRYVRLKMTVGGAGSTVTLWAKAVAREA